MNRAHMQTPESAHRRVLTTVCVRHTVAHAGAVNDLDIAHTIVRAVDGSCRHHLTLRWGGDHSSPAQADEHVDRAPAERVRDR